MFTVMKNTKEKDSYVSRQLAPLDESLGKSLDETKSSDV